MAQTNLFLSNDTKIPLRRIERNTSLPSAILRGAIPQMGEVIPPQYEDDKPSQAAGYRQPFQMSLGNPHE
jgi:hypothetical protein